MPAAATRRAIVTAFGGAAMLPRPALAQGSAWQPDRPVEIIVGAGPGGGNDRTARMIEQILREERTLPVPVVVVNRPGAGGAIAHAYLNRFAGDGNYLMVTNTALITNYISGIGDLTYTAATPIAQLLEEYIVAVTAGAGPVRSAQQFLDILKAAPGRLSIAVAPGPGAGTHLALAVLGQQLGIDITAFDIIPFGTAGQAITSVVAGQVDIMPATPLNVKPLVEAGTLRPLGITSPTRLTAPFQDTPTWRELGHDAVFSNWRGIVGPRDLRPEQVAYWSNVMQAVTHSARWRRSVDTDFVVPGFMDAAASERFLVQENARMETMLRQLGLAKR